MSILFKLFSYKEACRIPSPSRCLLTGSWFFSQQRVSYRAFFENMFSEVDIKSLMTAANLTLGEVIWLLFFELVLRILRTRTNKIAITYIEVVLYKTPF